jgi:hypothetical protein
MPVRARAEKSSVQFPALSETTLLIVIAVGFVILHVLTAVCLWPPSASVDPAPRPEAIGSISD